MADWQTEMAALAQDVTEGFDHEPAHSLDIIRLGEDYNPATGVRDTASDMPAPQGISKYIRSATRRVPVTAASGAIVWMEEFDVWYAAADVAEGLLNVLPDERCVATFDRSGLEQVGDEWPIVRAVTECDGKIFKITCRRDVGSE